MSPDETTELKFPPGTFDIPRHAHDLPEHDHEPKYAPNTGVAIGLIWIAMAALSLGFLWATTTFVGVERWAKYFADPESDAMMLVFAIGLVFIPVVIASAWTGKLISNK